MDWEDFYPGLPTARQIPRLITWVGSPSSTTCHVSVDEEETLERRVGQINLHIYGRRALLVVPGFQISIHNPSWLEGRWFCVERVNFGQSSSGSGVHHKHWHVPAAISPLVTDYPQMIVNPLAVINERYSRNRYTLPICALGFSTTN